MVLEGGNQDFVTGTQLACAPTVRDQVNCLGRAAGEHDLRRVAGIDKAGHDDSRAFICLCGGRCQLIGGAVHICVCCFIKSPFRLEHAARFLRGGGVI